MFNKSTQDELSQKIISSYSSSLISYNIQLSAAVLVSYDYLLTLPLELSLIWSGKANFMKMLFFVNRYAAIVNEYSAVFLYFIKPAFGTECHILYFIDLLTEFFSCIATYGVFTLRTFAIYGRSWTIFYILAIPALVDAASGLWIIADQSASAYPRQLQIGPNTCSIRDPFSNMSLSLFSSISTTIFDALVVILTIYRTFRIAMRSREANIHGSLSYIFLRDGILFYVAIFLPIFVYVGLDLIVLRDDSTPVSNVLNDLPAMVIAVRNIAVNRLVLSLSYTANSQEETEYRTKTGLEPPVFATSTILGNFGGLVRSIPDDFGELEEVMENDSEIDLTLQDETTQADYQSLARSEERMAP